jgi:hypothetical protein
MYDYLDALTCSAMTVGQYVNVVQLQYDKDPRSPKFAAPTTFSKAYTDTFCANVNGRWVMRCPVCKDCPKVLICDGTAVTMDAGRYSGQDVRSCPLEACKGSKLPSSLKRMQRTYADTAEQQHSIMALLQFVQSSTSTAARPSVPQRSSASTSQPALVANTLTPAQ